MDISFIPHWFFGLDVIFELAFAIITFLVAMYAFRVSKISGQNQPRLFGWAFIFFSISYLIQSFFNFAVISKVGESICNSIKVQNVSTLNALGMYFYMIFFMIGLVTLTYMTLKIRSPKTYLMVLVISLLSIIISLNKIYLFYFLSSLMLIFIVSHYVRNFYNNRKGKTLLVLIAFIFLLFGHIHFLISVNHELFYVIGHFFGLIAYFLILINLILVFKNGKKTK